jgi:hypothetical protein
MLKVTEFILSLPFVVIATIASFIMWNFLSTGEWKMRKRRFDPALVYQEQVTSLEWQLKEERLAHKAYVDELKQRHRKELQQQRRKL